MKISQKLTALAALTAATTAFPAPLTIEQQGTFAVGGTVVTSKPCRSPHEASNPDAVWSIAAHAPLRAT